MLNKDLYNKELYEILQSLGMVSEEDNDKRCARAQAVPDLRTDAEVFCDKTSRSLIDTMSFIDDLFLNNDETSIKKFLTVLIYNNNKK